MRNTLLLLLLVLFPGIIRSQFIEVTDIMEIQNISFNTYIGNGVSFYDFNGDGWDDLTLGNYSSAPKFYVNNQGSFTPVSFNLNFNFSEMGSMNWVDFDNDGDNDLFCALSGGPVYLYRNTGNMVFEDITVSAGFNTQAFLHYGTCWGDYDRDGFLDLFLAKYYFPSSNPNNNFTSRLFHNNGDGTFTDVTVTAGVFYPQSPTFQGVWMDYNNDNWPDLHIIVDRNWTKNRLYENNGNGTFTEVSEVANVDLYIDAMTNSVDDFDNDGDLDIYVTNGPWGNVLLRNNGNEIFSDVTQSYGVAVNKVCWGALWLDHDNDGWRDLFVATTIGEYQPDLNRWYTNTGSPPFVNSSVELGIGSDNDPTFATAMGDINNDGYYDYVNNNNDPFATSIWLNDGGTNHFLSIELEGTISNKQGIGNWIHVHANDQTYHQYSILGENYMGQNSGKDIFGLAQATIVDSIEIDWISGLVEVYYDVAVDQFLTFVEGASFDFVQSLETEDYTICTGQTITLDAGEAEGYLWNNGHDQRFLEVTEPGMYFATLYQPMDFIQYTDTVEMLLQEPIATIVASDALCYGGTGSIDMVAMEYGTISEINWSGECAMNLENTIPGTYGYELISTSGCSVSGEVIINQPDSIQYQLNVDEALCFGNSAVVEVVQIIGGIEPYMLEWSAEMNAFFQGEHWVTLTDANGCTSTQNFLINEPPLLVSSVSTQAEIEAMSLGLAELNIEGGTSPYEIEWSNGILNEYTVQLNAGVYSVVITDFNGCSVLEEFEIDLILGMEDLFQEELEVYPSPVVDYLQFNCTSNWVNGYVTIVNAEGKNVFETKIISPMNVIDCTSWSSGTYFMSIKKGSEIISKPFIKK